MRGQMSHRKHEEITRSIAWSILSLYLNAIQTLYQRKKVVTSSAKSDLGDTMLSNEHQTPIEGLSHRVSDPRSRERWFVDLVHAGVHSVHSATVFIHSLFQSSGWLLKARDVVPMYSEGWDPQSDLV